MVNDLPRSYQKYLDDTKPLYVNTVRPVLQESAASGEYGVLVRYMRSEVQATISERIPYGEIREEHLE